MWASAAPLIDAASCARLIEACRPAVEAQPRSQSYLGLVDYRALGLSACGPAAVSALEASGAAAAAASATGVPSRRGEDLMVACTKAWQPEPASDPSLEPTAARLEALESPTDWRVIEGDVDSEGFLLDEWHRGATDEPCGPGVLNVRLPTAAPHRAH